MKCKDKASWIPADGMDLESAALETVKSKENLLVVAGPGAGKTELLAQRACYLLETNECKWPKRILAISFKRDAASNIKERVKRRCGEELAERFDSFTFDAFAGMLLNHFHHKLPTDYKISVPYEIILRESDIFELYKQSFSDRMAKTQEKDAMDKHHRKLPLNTDGMSFDIWRQLLKAKPSRLSYRMIMRLAQLILSQNEEIKLYLQNTYAYVFLDEFQDTTFLQYEFLNTCFEQSTVIITAVGDNKQKIMGWAGANPKIFDEFKEEYHADEKRLLRNFRSAPRLVELQNYLIKELLKQEIQMQAGLDHKDPGDAFLYEFESPEYECDKINTLIKQRMKEHSLSPRDFCILVKQQVGIYPKKFYEIKNEDYSFRDEDNYSKLFSDEVFSFLINCLALTARKFDANTWEKVQEFLFSISYNADEDKNYRYQKRFERKIQEYRNVSDTNQFLDDILDFINKKKIKAVYSEYRREDKFNETKQTIIKLIKNRSSQGMSLRDSLLDIKGDNSIPIMTIHKSKGLEYDTVIFLGLEDNPFRNMGAINSEDENAFFVALSRAKNQVIFTFCNERPDRNGVPRRQTRDNIGQLYTILKDSGIVEFISQD
ncbi:MAG: ATP-dependent helicase [Fibrobacteraceae bacterium]|nr:ATP-dependent helicase [Fibrobacteraceae bacterium]